MLGHIRNRVPTETSAAPVKIVFQHNRPEAVVAVNAIQGLRLRTSYLAFTIDRAGSSRASRKIETMVEAQRPHSALHPKPATRLGIRVTSLSQALEFMSMLHSRSALQRRDSAIRSMRTN